MPPNVIIIMTDQQRADCSGREGFPLDTTPFLDGLAREGVWFNRAYTPMPVCGPARVSLLTGRYPSATHVRTNWNIPDAFYDQDLFDIFKNRGYATALCGKNHSHLTPNKVDDWYECGHLGIDDPDRSAEERAFDDFLKGTHFHMSVPPTPYPVQCQIPHRLVNHATGWLDSLGDKPFLLWLSFPEPHNPYQVPEPYYSLFPPESLPPPKAGDVPAGSLGFKHDWCRQSFEKAFPDYAETIPRARSNYYGMLRLLDDEIHRFVMYLEQSGLRENTLLVFLSDHGDFVGDYGLLRKGAGLHEALTRIPLQISGPGIRPSATPHAEHVSLCDILPTLCEACGLPLPPGVQGRSLWPLLSGASCTSTEFRSAFSEHGFGGLDYEGNEPLDPAEDGFRESRSGEPGAYDCLNSRTQSGTMRMVRKGDWKLVLNSQAAGRLYDLKTDPMELTNLYGHADVSAVQTVMLEELAAWLLRVQDPLPLPRTRYVMKTDLGNDHTPKRPRDTA